MNRPSMRLEDREDLRNEQLTFYSVARGVLAAAERLFINERQHEYGPPAGNFLYGDEAYAQTLWLKMSRLLALVELRRNALAQGGWSEWGKFDRGKLVDSLLDLINYAAFWAADVHVAGAWPERAPEVVPVTGDSRAGSMEKCRYQVQCPKCQGLQAGSFGCTALDKWFLGCETCGYERKSTRPGALLLWYGEAMQGKRMTRYGENSDQAHVVKKTQLRTVERPEVECYGDVEAFGGEDYPAEEVDPKLFDPPSGDEKNECERQEREDNWIDRAEEMEEARRPKTVVGVAAQIGVPDATGDVIESEAFEGKTSETPLMEGVEETLLGVVRSVIGLVGNLEAIPDDAKEALLEARRLEAEFRDQELTTQTQIATPPSAPETPACPCGSGLSPSICHPRMVSQELCPCGGTVEVRKAQGSDGQVLQTYESTCFKCGIGKVSRHVKGLKEWWAKSRDDARAMAAPGKELTPEEREQILKEMKE